MIYNYLPICKRIIVLYIFCTKDFVRQSAFVSGCSLSKVTYTNEIPGNYAEIFVKLDQINIYPDDFAAKMVSIAKFRNKLVHGYWKIDPSMVYLILQEDVLNIYQFRSYLIEFSTK